MQINLTVRSIPWLALLLLLGNCLFSCEEIGSMKPPPPAPELTPRAAYLEALHYSGLGESQLVQAWKDAAQSALEDSVEVAVPFKVSLCFTRRKVRPAFATAETILFFSALVYCE